MKFTEDLFDEKINELHNRIDVLEDERSNLEDKLSDQEDRNRRNNLRIDGIKEHERENEEQLEEKVKKLLKKHLKQKRILKYKESIELGETSEENHGQLYIIFKDTRIKQKYLKMNEN